MATTRAVLLDLGETLWHFPTMPPFELIRGETVRRINALLLSWGIEPERDLFFLGRDIRFALEDADREAYYGDRVSPHCPTLAKQVAAEKGLHLTDEQAEELWLTWNLGGAFFGRALYEGTLDTLNWLRERGYRLGAVTNRHVGGEPFREEMRQLGVLDHFDVLSISCDVGYMKPHPRIFQHALDALAVSPQEAVMVGDSLRADVGGAQALSMLTVWRRNHPAGKEGHSSVQDGPAGTTAESAHAQPDYVVESLWEVIQLPIFR